MAEVVFRKGKNTMSMQCDEVVRCNCALAARLAEAERLLATYLWWDGGCKADLNDDTWKFLGFPPDPRLSVNEGTSRE